MVLKINGGHPCIKWETKSPFQNFYFSSTMRYLVVTGILWTFLTLFLKEIILLLTPNYYHSAYQFAPIIIFGYIFLGIGNIWSAGLHLQNKGRWFWILSSFGAATNIILNFILVPRYGIFAAAITTFISFSIQPIGYIIITKNTMILICLTIRLPLYSWVI